MERRFADWRMRSLSEEAGIGMLTQPKSQSVGQTCAFETDSRGSDEICSRCTGKGSLRAERPPEFEAVLWENPMYGILERALETGLWRIYTDTKLETVDTDNDGLKLLRQCSTRPKYLLFRRPTLSC